MTTQIKQIIAEMREKEMNASVGDWELRPSSDNRPYIFLKSESDKFSPLIKTYRHNLPGSANADFIVYTRNNITAILDYVAKLEKKVTEISSGYMHCQAAFALLDEKYRNRKVKA